MAQTLSAQTARHATGLSPVDLEAARAMITEVHALQTPRGDLEALARAIVALSQLALRPELGVREAEINPLLVLPEGQGVLAVDALVLRNP